jgi:hypothetical protein
VITGWPLRSLAAIPSPATAKISQMAVERSPRIVKDLPFSFS